MKPIILAAGIGSRLKPITDDLPKCMIEINGKTLLERHLSIFNELGLKEVYIAVGYKKEKIISKYGKSFLGIKITYIENEDHKNSGSGYSLWLASKGIEEEIIFMDADLAYKKADLLTILASKKTDYLIIDDNKKVDAEGVKVVIDGELVKEMGKNIHPKLPCEGEAIGIVKLSKEAYRKYLEKMNAHVKRNNLKFEWENILNDSIADLNLNYESIAKNSWVEIDFIPDLKIAQKILSKE